MLGRLRASLVDAIFPPRCLTCTAATAGPHGLCASCWRDTHFIAGQGCWKCGLPVAGEAEAGELCETCLKHPPAWDRGRAATIYGGASRRAILQFKHGDRLDMAPALGNWLLAAGGDLVAAADLLVPVPLHWRRLMRRRYNQSAELGRQLARWTGTRLVADLLVRSRMTVPQERMDHDARRANQAGAIIVAAKRAPLVAGKQVLLIDDVMTSGATLSACAEACRAAGAARVDVLVVARVAIGGSGP